MGDVSAATTTHSVVFLFKIQMGNNYSVYEHVTPDGMYYFGQTNDIKRRWRNNGAGYKKTSLEPYIEKYGWENIKHIVLFKDQTKEDAIWIEDFLITTAREDGVCINKNRSGLISKEEDYDKNQSKQYYEQNKQQISDQRKQYYEQNKDKIKQYYEQNKDKIKEQSKQYREQNKDRIREYKRQYREKNRDKINEYKRQYRERKKLEKQLKEVETTPLF